MLPKSSFSNTQWEMGARKRSCEGCSKKREEEINAQRIKSRHDRMKELCCRKCGINMIKFTHVSGAQVKRSLAGHHLILCELCSELSSLTQLSTEQCTQAEAHDKMKRVQDTQKPIKHSLVLGPHSRKNTHVRTLSRQEQSQGQQNNNSMMRHVRSCVPQDCLN